MSEKKIFDRGLYKLGFEIQYEGKNGASYILCGKDVNHRIDIGYDRAGRVVVDSYNEGVICDYAERSCSSPMSLDEVRCAYRKMKKFKRVARIMATINKVRTRLGFFGKDGK